MAVFIAAHELDDPEVAFSFVHKGETVWSSVYRVSEGLYGFSRQGQRFGPWPLKEAVRQKRLDWLRN